MMKMVTKNNTILINLIAREQEQKTTTHKLSLVVLQKIGAATLQPICIQNFITANSITLCCRVYCISMKVFRFDTFQNEMSLAFYYSLSLFFSRAQLIYTPLSSEYHTLITN